MTFFGPDLRNGLPIGLGSVAGFGIAPQFSPASLFLGGTVQGAWYDPSDATTLFSDRAGTTPCGTPGGGSVVPVGAMLDKRAAGYSVFFDGTGDYLVAANSADLSLPGDFTIEFWINFASLAANPNIFTLGASNSPNNGLLMYHLTASNRLFLYSNGATILSGTAASAVTTGTWNHIAVVRSGSGSNNLQLYVNGVLAGQATNTVTLTGVAANGFVMGAAYTTSYSDFTNGYVSNLRVVKGTAVYTGAFTPAGPLSPITGTSLLTCGTSWTGNPAITKNGDARVDGLNPFTASPVGNHAIAANDTTARPELRARVNLLTYSEDQSNGVWSNYSATQQSNVGVAPDGTNTADRIVEAAGSSLQARYQTILSGLGISHTVSAYAKADQRNVFNLSYSGAGGTNWFAATFELTGNGSVTKTGAGAAGTYTSSSITPVGNGWYFCTVTGNPGQASTHYAYGGPSDTTNPTYGNFGVLTYNGNTANGILVWGFDVRPANIGTAMPAYQRISDANTYDAVGFPRYLVANGTSSAMSTPGNVNLSGTDKVTVFAGVRKLAEASYPTIVEFSVNSSVNTGSFSAYTSGSSTPRYPVYLFGTASTGYEPQTYAAPISNVLAVGYDIGAADRSTEVIPRINGVVNQTNPVGAAAAGTGNFGSYPLFIGARNNSSLFFNGNLYSLIVVGSAVSAGQISATEQWVAQRTGIVI